MNFYSYIIACLIGFVASFLSGTTAVGGAALMTVVLTLLLGGEYAVPVLTIVMLMANLTRAISGFHEIDWKSVGFFNIPALPLSLCGALGFVLLPKYIVNKLLGFAVIAFVVFKVLSHKEKLIKKKGMLFSFGLASGFLSGFVGSSGPVSAAVFFSLGLTPVGYVASEAAAVSMLHIAKIIVYSSLMNISQSLWIFAFVTGCSMIVGTVFAHRFISHLRTDVFNNIVSIAMVLMGVYMMTQ